jgi:SAM-dependent methyltransferase
VDPLAQVDVTEIMRQIREQAGRQRQKFALSSMASPRRNSQVAEDLGFLQSSQDISQVRFSSHRKVVGDIIILVKRVLQQLLTPIFERQSAYNAVNARLVASLYERVERMEERVASALDTLQAEEKAFLDALRETITGQLEVLAQQQATSLQALQMEVASQSRERRAQERHLTRLLDEVRQHLSDPLSQDRELLQTFTRPEKRPMDAFLAAFDEQFRGTRTHIKDQLRVYLTPLVEAKIGTSANPIVDLGCGRGEWLELLQEEGLQGKGVERNHVLVEECRQARLDVVEGDMLTYLCALPNSSIGGVTGFHIIEHLPFEVLLDVFDETVRVLQSGGVAIFETPNPQNVLVSTLGFYSDPSHHTPLPSTLLKCIAELKGLQRIELLQLHPFPEAHKVQEAGLEIAKRFNELFYGPQDYALVGWKP